MSDVICNIDFAKVNTALKRCGSRGMPKALKVLADASKRQVPVDTHALQESCRVVVHEDTMSGTVEYGNEHVGYAIVQHENTEFHHENGRKAKYLEDPANDPEIQKKMVIEIADAARKEL